MVLEMSFYSDQISTTSNRVYPVVVQHILIEMVKDSVKGRTKKKRVKVHILTAFDSLLSVHSYDNIMPSYKTEYQGFAVRPWKRCLSPWDPHLYRLC
jgi:hypothetical protein